MKFSPSGPYMMLPTHGIVGLAIATPLTFIAPEFTTATLTGALAGSVFPDLDLYAGHRRTLHYPTVYPLLALPASVLAAWVSTFSTVFIALFLVGAAVHCQMDRFGGGLELRPWEGTSDRAVYDHVRNRWRKPKRLVRYDGAPEDFALALFLGIPLVVVLSSPFRWIVFGLLIVGGSYAVLRRRLASIAPIVFSYVPDRFQQYVPERYRS